VLERLEDAKCLCLFGVDNVGNILNQVSITAESKQEKDVKENGKVIRSERYYGSLYRTFTLGQDVDQGAASAKYADGILQLTLPKKATAATKKLTVRLLSRLTVFSQACNRGPAGCRSQNGIKSRANSCS